MVQNGNQAEARNMTALEIVKTFNKQVQGIHCIIARKARKEHSCSAHSSPTCPYRIQKGEAYLEKKFGSFYSQVILRYHPLCYLAGHCHKNEIRLHRFLLTGIPSSLPLIPLFPES
ncbi:hypothetical protein LCGC14_1995310 [marine sediment metagenome]|uniref:Uncharacterized protein n=1 Tax=marine sediment metagenome TaxID=412755 RepID=A0A0F9FSV8_9ZZZZ